MNWTLYNLKTGVRLTLGKLPHRAQKCFYFEENGVITPVAYIHRQREKEAERLWDAVTDGIPSGQGRLVHQEGK